VVAVVSVETVLLVLLVVLVAGLLRSHAEILRRLGPAGEPGAPAGPGIAPPPGGARTASDTPAVALSGPTPDGDVVRLDFAGGAAGPTLLAFLTSGCSACAGFWETLGERRLPPDVQTVIVTHGSGRERPPRLRSLAPPGIPVVMSSEAWQDYAVPGAPYFVLVDEAVRGQGAATTWAALSSLVRDAIEDAKPAGAGSVGSSAGAELPAKPVGAGSAAPTGSARARRVEETLAAAGIGPEHPSLYPGRPASLGDGQRDAR
jgi:hypothetical protein